MHSSSITLPLGAARYLTPLFLARCTLSGKGKNASLEQATPSSLAAHSFFSASVRASTLPFEQTLPLLFLSALKNLTGDEEVDSIGLLGAFDALLEWEGEDSRVVPEPPQIGFPTSQTSAVDTGLLAGTQADNRTVKSVRDTV